MKAYIIPSQVFESEEQKEDLLRFIERKRN